IAGVIAAAVLAVTAVLALLAGAAVSMFSSQSAGQLAAGACPVQSGMHTALGQWNGTQMTNAATIVAVGQARRVPTFGEVVAVAPACKEPRRTTLPGVGRGPARALQGAPPPGLGPPPAGHAARLRLPPVLHPPAERPRLAAPAPDQGGPSRGELRPSA